MSRKMMFALVAVVLVTGCVGISSAQENAARVQATMSSVIGAAATGMGGAFVAVADDGTALYWNPAALADNSGFRIYGAVGGASQNIDTIQDLIDVADILGEEDELSEEDFDLIRDVAQRNDGVPVEGGIGAIGTIEFSQFALGYWAMAAGNGVLNYTQNIGAEMVDWTADAAGQAGAGIGYGRNISGPWNVGVTARLSALSLGYADGNAEMQVVPNATVDSNNVTDSDTDTSYTVDLGVLYSADGRNRFGLVGRNLTSPSFDLELNAQQISAEIDPSVDLGFAHTTSDGSIIALDAHNVFEANDAGCELAVGISKPLCDIATLRLGYGNGTPTFGLGFTLGGFQLDLASALDWEDRVAIGASGAF